MRYMVITISISYSIHDEQLYMIVLHYIIYLHCISSYEVISLLPVLSEKHIYILFLMLCYIKAPLNIRHNSITRQ